jgi:hypothetical protein
LYLCVCSSTNTAIRVPWKLRLRRWLP